MVSGARELDRFVGEGGLVLRRRRKADASAAAVAAVTRAVQRGAMMDVSELCVPLGRSSAARADASPRERTRRRASFRAPAASIDLSTATNAHSRETVFYEPRVPRRRSAALHHRQLAGSMLASRAAVV